MTLRILFSKRFFEIQDDHDQLENFVDLILDLECADFPPSIRLLPIKDERKGLNGHSVPNFLYQPIETKEALNGTFCLHQYVAVKSIPGLDPCSNETTTSPSPITGTGTGTGTSPASVVFVASDTLVRSSSQDILSSLPFSSSQNSF